MLQRQDEPVFDRAHLLKTRSLYHEAVSLRACLERLRAVLGARCGPAAATSCDDTETSAEAVSQLSSSTHDDAAHGALPQVKPSSELARALQRLLRVASAVAHRRAECEVLADDIRRASATAAAGGGKGRLPAAEEEEEEKSADDNGRGEEGEEEAVVVRRVRQLDSENDALRARVELLRQRLHHLEQTRRRGGGTAPPGRQRDTATVGQSVRGAHDNSGGDRITASMAAYRRETAKERQRGVLLEEALELALARHRGRSAALAYCAAANPKRGEEE